MKYLREEVGTKACIVGKIVKSRMKWAGHMVRTKDDKLPKRSETKKQERFQKRARPQASAKIGGLCEERSEKGRVGRKWREKANNRDQWKRVTIVAVLRSAVDQLDQPHPYTRETGGRTRTRNAFIHASVGEFQMRCYERTIKTVTYHPSKRLACFVIDDNKLHFFFVIENWNCTFVVSLARILRSLSV